MSLCQRPLFFGRLLRVLLGSVLLGLAGFGFVTHPQYALGTRALLLFFGASFVTGGVRATPGCEITALPNLFLPSSRQLTCWCPLFSPIDSIERRLPAKH